MPYELIEHTADIKIRVWEDSLENLFSEAMLAMMSFLRQPKAGPPLAENTKMYESTKTIQREIRIEAPDKTALLVDFLNEVLALSQTHKEVYMEVEFSKFSETALEATLQGVKVDKFDEDIKAVTYHEAEIRQNEKGEWETIIVFDI